MAQADRDPDVGARLDLAADNAFRARHNAEASRHKAMAAGRAAAASLRRSADSQERIAKAYERVAENGVRPDEYREHAAVHRSFAQEDHRMAERLRKLMEG